MMEKNWDRRSLIFAIRSDEFGFHGFTTFHAETIMNPDHIYEPVTRHKHSVVFFEQLPLDIFIPQAPEEWKPLTEDEIKRKELEQDLKELKEKYGKKTADELKNYVKAAFLSKKLLSTE